MNPGRRRCVAAMLCSCAAVLGRAAFADTPGSSLAWAADPATARAQALLEAVRRARWVQEGSGPRVAYVFIDPNCPYSHRLYLATRAFVGQQGLALRWIIVGTLERSSPAKAAAILQAPDPLQAFRYNEDNWDFGDSPAGGIRPLEHPLPTTVQALQRNAQIMHDAGLSVFPDLLFRDRGGQPRLYVGLLPADALPAVLGAVGP